MNWSWLRTTHSIRCAALIAWAALAASPCVAAIAVGHVDDFQDGTLQYWRIGQTSNFPTLAEDAGPQGPGDDALFTSNTAQGSRPLLIVLNDQNEQFPDGGNWEGSWTAAGVTRISMDVRNPGTVLGASTLKMRLGIAGPEGVGSSGFGDDYFTDSIIVPMDNAWHSITFDVLPADWTPVSTAAGINAALANVTHFRIYSNQFAEFIGGGEPNEFYLDNIRALGPAALAGDYNGNGSVDAADYVLWRKTLNQSVAPGTGADGTGPGGTPDGMVTSLDYDFWRARFGNSLTGGGAAISTSTVVPEPATWLLAMSFLLVGFRRSR